MAKRTSNSQRSAALQRAIERRKRHAQKRGIALIMVLGAITILTVFLTELQTDTSAALAGALADRDRLKAEYYAKSAVNLSRMLLASEKMIRTDPAVVIITQLMCPKLKQIPVWEFSDLILGAFNGGDKVTAFGTNVGVDVANAKNIGIPGKDYFSVKIIDEDSKININSASSAAPPMQLMLQLATVLARPEYAPMFEQRDADDQFSDAATVCASMIDWADPDENLTSCIDPTKPASGAEDNIYQMLGFDYRRKNAPYDSLDELRLVRGMDDDRWATFVDPDPNEPKKRLMTVWGQDTGSNPININTANAQTIWGVVCSIAPPQTPICTDPLQAASFLQVINLVRGLAPGLPLFCSATDLKKALKGQGMVGQFLSMMNVTPVELTQKSSELKKLFKVESKMFSIYAEGVVPGKQREARVRVHAVIDMRELKDWTKPPDAATPPVLDENAPVDDEFIKEWKTNPFGQVIYYRVD